MSGVCHLAPLLSLVHHEPMNKRYRMCALAVLSIAGGSGCISAEQHRETLSDLQRLRMEAWQRGVEASALRMQVERMTVENAQLRAYSQMPNPAVSALSAKVDDLARKQEEMLGELRSVPACAPAAPAQGAAQTASGAAQTPPAPGRKVTDLLYSRY